MGKLLKNNFFVDGEKLLRHMSPEVNNRESINSSNENFQHENVAQTCKPSAVRPASKSKHRYDPDSGRVTLDHESLHTHQRNKIQILNGFDEKSIKTKVLSQQLSSKHEVATESPQLNKSKASELDRLVKKNIKKMGKLNTEELIKKFMEET